AFGAALIGANAAQAADIPSTPEPGTVKIAVEPWLGYGQWYVAQKKGFYAKEGLKDVQIISFQEDKDLDAAMAGGKVTVACVATNTALAMIAAGLPMKAVLLMDFSNSADAILSKDSITSIQQLKGKQVAYEEGTTSDVLLHYALSHAQMPFSDVDKVPMPADSAGNALIAGRVPVAVTYEPYISAALAAGKGFHRLYIAGVDPGLISDVLIVPTAMIARSPGQIEALIRTWQDAMEYYNANVKDGRTIIAQAVGSDLASLNSAFDGVTYYTVPAARDAFNGSFRDRTFGDVLKAAQQAGLVNGNVTADQALDASFLNAAK
ncbi:MAG TPA: ABC transporter substrate-binding protein, partial [Terriglobia bacterium]|nr:ABC transporter substrate-binding protein [Terriglobia bacterium]